MRYFRFFLVLSLVFLSFLGFSQSVSFSNPDDFAVCNEAGFEVVITNNTGSDMANLKVTMDFPCEIEYVANSIVGGSEGNVSNLQKPVFELVDLAAGSSVTLQFQAHAPCAVSGCVDAGELFVYSLDLDYTGGQLHNVSSPQFDVKTSLLVFTKVESPVLHGVKGETLIRKFTIRNTRPGPVRYFTFTDVHDLGLEMSSDDGTDISTTNGEFRLEFGAADFMNVGDGDGLLEQGEELILTEKVKINICGQEQITALSDISLGWGCGGEICTHFDVNAIVYVELDTELGDVLSFDSIVTDPLCYCGSNLLPQGLIVSNNSTRNDVSLMELSLVPTASFDAFFQGTVRLVQDGDTTELTPKYNDSASQPCLPNAATYLAMEITIPSIPAGTQATVLWDMVACSGGDCQSKGMAWSFSGAYYKECTLPEDTYHEIDVHTVKANDNISAALEVAPLEDGMEQTMLYHVSSPFLDEESGALHLSLELPCGMSLLPTVDWQFDGVAPMTVDTMMTLDKITHVDLSYAMPLPDSLGDLAIPVVFVLDPDCYGTEPPPKDSLFSSCPHVCVGEASCSSVSSSARISANAEMAIEPFCSPGCNIQYCNLFSTSFGGATSGVCLDTVIGYMDYSFDLYRTTLGQPDNDNDHVADAGGSIDLGAIRRDRAVAGDTVHANINGIVVADVPNVSFSNGYIELWITVDSSFGVQPNLKSQELKQLLEPTTGFQNFYKGIKIYDKSAGVYYTCPAVPDGEAPNLKGQLLAYYYDISPASLSMAGGDVPVDYRYEKGDSILFMSDYRINYNFQNGSSFGFFSLKFEPKIYLTEKASPAPEDLFACDCKNRNLEIGNIAFFAQEGLANTVDICQGKTSGKGLLFSFFYGIFPNFFPNEYRRTAMIHEIRVPRIEGLELSESYIEYATLNGQFILDYPDSTVIHYSSIEPASVAYPNEDVTGFYIFKRSDFPELFWDDNVYVRMRLNYENTSCLFQGGNNYLGGLSSDLLPQNDAYHEVLDTVAKFRLTGKHPSLNLDFDLCDKIELSDSISWDFSLSNVLNLTCPNDAVTDAPNVWLYPVADNGLVDGFQLYNRKTGAEVLAQNGIFQLDSLAQCDTVYLHLVGINHDCAPVDVRFNYGWSCAPYTDLIQTPCVAQSGSCQVTSPPGVIDLVPDSLDLSAGLCEEMPWSYVEVFDAGLGSVFDLAVEAQLPPGMVISPGSSEMEWPTGSGQFVSVDDPDDLGGNVYKWVVTNALDTLKAHGLPGVNSAPANSVTIRFKTVTNCDFIAGAFIIYSATANKICDLPTNTIAQIGGEMNVTSITAPYATAITVGSDGYPGCGDSLMMSVNLSFSDTTGSYDTLFAQLPTGISFVAGSCSGDFGSCTPVISGNELRWGLPQGLTDASLSFSVVGFLGYDCKTVAIPFYATSQATASCAGMPQDCDIKVQTGAQVATIKIEKPVFSIDAFIAHPQAGSDSLVDLQIEITNVGILNTTPIVFKLYLDNDGDGLVSAGDDWVQDFSFEKYLEEDEKASFNIFAQAISPEQICKLMIVVGEPENCVCAETVVKVQTPILYPAVVVDTICSGEMISIGRPELAGHHYQWDGGVSGIACPTCSQTTFTKENETFNAITYSLKLKDDGDCLLSYEYVITVLPKPRIWSADDQVCMGDIATLVASDGATYQWQGEGVTDPSAQIQMVSPLSTGLYSVTITNEKGCSETDAVTVVVLAVPQANAGADFSVCRGKEAHLNATVEAGNQLTWTPGAPKLNDASIANPTILTDETTTFTLTVSNGACTATDEVTVSFFDGVQLTVSPDQAVCLGDTVQLEVSGADTYTWTPMLAGMCQDAACAKVEFVPTTDLHFTVTGTNADGCEATAEVNVLIIEDTLVTNSDLALCHGSSVIIFGQEVTSAGVYCDTIEHSAGCYEIKCVTVSELDSILVKEEASICAGETYVLDGQSYTESGEYCVTKTSVGGCDSTYCVDLTVWPSPDVSILPKDAFIQIGDSVQLAATTGLGSYHWSPSGFLSCTDCEAPFAFPDQTTWFYVQVVDGNGCSHTDSVLVQVETLCDVEVKIPNAFTPNGDGKNDFFRVANLSYTLSDVDITVYSRWGEKVYSGQGNAGWDGKYKGKEMPSDVYVYLIKLDCVDGEKRLLKGNVTLLR